MTQQRIIQISDIHLTAYPNQDLYGVDTANSLERAITDIQNLEPAADLIIVTGDITEDGSETSYLRFAKLMEALNCPVYVLSGNHDLPANMASVFATSPIIKYQQHIELNGWHLLLLDSQVPGEEFGQLDNNQLLQLEQGLENAGQAPVLVALHHTPGKVCPSSGCQLHQPEDLLHMLSEAPNVQAVIAGHTHNDSDQSVNGIRVLTCPSTFAYAHHAQVEDNVDHEDFWASHQLDINRQGYRIIDINGAEITATRIAWF